MNKKAQGISLETIIVAIIVIMVLVILVLVFATKMGWFVKESNSCEAKGGICNAQGVTSAACDVGNGYLPVPGGSCTTGFCCTKPK